MAAPLFWDGTDTTANADGGAGIWDSGTIFNWDTLATGGANSVWTNANNDTAVFAGVAGTVSLGSAITVGGLQFDTSDYVVQSNTLTFGLSGNILTNANATIQSALAVTTGLTLTKTGSGTLTLSGNNTYVGATTISTGTLKAGSITGLSANSVFSVAAGAILDLGGFNNTIKSLSTATGTITDSSGAGLGGILKISTAMPTGPSTQLFTGSMGLQFFGGNTVNTVLSNTANTYSGGTIIGNGSGTTNTRILLSGTVGAGSPGAVTSGIFGTGTITIGGATTDRSQFYFAGATTINNAFVVNSAAGLGGLEVGAFRSESTGVVLAGAINANLADATFNAMNTAGRTVNITGAISGVSGVTVTTANVGTLTVTLTNTGTANSYAGNTTVSTAASTLALGAANQIPNGAGKGNLIVTGGTFSLGGFSDTINGLSGTGTVDGISGTPTLTVGDNDVTSSFSGIIKNTAGTLALTKIGTGTLTLSGNNTYGGATTISAGTIKSGSITGLSANSAFSITTGATLDLGGFNNTIKSLSTATGTITDSSGAGLGGTLRISTAMPAGPSAQLFTGSLGLQLYGGNNSNTILSNTANTYSGGTILGNGSGSTNTRLLLGGGTLGAGSPGAITSGLFGTGAISIGAAATDMSQLYFSGALTINNAIVVNTAAGTDQPGTFRVESGGSILAGAINANLADALFAKSNAGTGSINVTGAISGASGVTVSTTGSAALTVTLTNTGTANSYAGNTTVSTTASTLALGAANQIPNGAGKGNLIVTGGTFSLGGFSDTINGLSGTGTVDGISGTPTLTVGDNDVTSSFSGIIKNTAGTLALTKIGTGTLTLSGNNTYTGATTISVGTLIVNGDQTSAAGAVTVTSGTTLGGVGTIGGDTTISGNLRIGSDIANGTTGLLNFAGGKDLTFANGSTWLIDIVNDNFDSLGGIDVFTIDSGANLQFLFTGTQTQSSYTIATYGSRANSNTFYGFVDGASVGSGYQINYGPTAITLTAVPEPSSVIGLALLLAGTLRFGRRRIGRTS